MNYNQLWYHLDSISIARYLDIGPDAGRELVKQPAVVDTMEGGHFNKDFFLPLVGNKQVPHSFFVTIVIHGLADVPDRDVP